MKLYYWIYICLFSITIITCTSKGNDEMQGNPSEENKTMIVTAPIVYKNFVSKQGTITDRVDTYLQMSAQDYFIKFNESDISVEDFELYCSNLDDDLKIITVEIEIRNGSWDFSYSDINDINDPVPQSRIGEYVIIHNIIESEN